MIIALDYDGTMTEDIEAWLDFIDLMEDAGHTIYIVTMRYPSEGLPIGFSRMQVVFTSRKAKKPFLDALGIHVNVWIDDHPQAVFMDAEQIWGQVLPEGQPSSMNAVDVK